jgi:hypothetical protein
VQSFCLRISKRQRGLSVGEDHGGFDRTGPHHQLIGLDNRLFVLSISCSKSVQMREESINRELQGGD